jgi:dTDP-4-dehydrorhamnose reductase
MPAEYPERVLLTGGSGHLGRELLRHLEMTAPPSSELDLTKSNTIARSIERYKPDLVVHAAAYTDVRGAERDRKACWAVNVGGTRSLLRELVSRKIPLVYISTDYVFYGDRGHYLENDQPGPARNHYGLSKLVAEEVVRVHQNALVIRTSFRPRQWPYPVAFDDVYTSQDYVDVIGPDIALAIRHYASIPFNTLHIATERKSVFELAQRRKPDVERGSRTSAGVDLPEDISLDTSRWQTLRGTLIS